MAEVIILKGFTAYPSGKREHFAKGATATVTDEVAAQWSSKGLARCKPDAKSAQTPAAMSSSGD